MNRIFSFLVTFLFLFSLTGCQNRETELPKEILLKLVTVEANEDIPSSDDMEKKLEESYRAYFVSDEAYNKFISSRTPVMVLKYAVETGAVITPTGEAAFINRREEKDTITYDFFIDLNLHIKDKTAQKTLTGIVSLKDGKISRFYFSTYIY